MTPTFLTFRASWLWGYFELEVQVIWIDSRTRELDKSRDCSNKGQIRKLFDVVLGPHFHHSLMSDVHINMKCPASLAPVTMWGGWIWISQSEVSTLPHWPMRGRRAGYWGWHILMVLVPGAKFRVRLYCPVSPRVAPAPALRPASHSSPGAAQTLTEHSDQIQDSNRINSNLLLTIDTLKC